jgi:hypothetical protein
MTRSIAAIRRRRVLMLNSRRSPGISPWTQRRSANLLCSTRLRGRQEEIGVAIVECQQACPVTLALEQLQGGKDFQQMLLAADRKNDCDRRQENDLDYPCSMRFSLSGDKLE